MRVENDESKSEEAAAIKNSLEQISGVSSVDSAILKNSWEVSLLKEWISEVATPNFTLIYRGSRDGWRATNFHTKCDMKGPTVLVVKSHLGKIFGGFTDVDWDLSSNYKTSNDCFLYSIDKKAKYKIKSNQTNRSIYASPDRGPTFGGGFDLYIADNCNSSDSNSSNFPVSYVCKEYSYPGAGQSDWLAGANKFNVDEIEVFAVQKKN